LELNKDLTVQFVGDGQQAMELLQGEGMYSDRTAYPVPDLMLMDLRMPRKDGLELLGWVRSQPQFEKLPVIVYSDSVKEGIAALCKKLGADHFVIKDLECGELMNVLRPYCCSLQTSSAK
jgi:CheY-like chemotaxis protein